MLKNELGFESQIEKLDRRISILEIVAWSFVGLGLIGLFVGFYFWYCLNGELNEVGDFIGGVTGSLWALAGLFFIYIAFLGQKVEIKYQQEDLTLTREELKETKEVFKQQTQVMISQQLDNTFFNLLDNHRKLVNSFSTKKERYEGFFRSMIDRKKANEPVSGYEVLENISKAWRDLFEKHSKYHSSRKIFDFNIANKQPLKIVKNEKDVLLLYNEVIDIMNFIKNRIYINNRVFYFKILRNNLTFDERYLVEAYNYFFGNEELPYSFNPLCILNNADFYIVYFSIKDKFVNVLNYS
ncbi:hypothetical protein [Wocania ichthyoenteri]|uniref:hypothetical protein n=1 Tax=Wocania ichthyoenteri TaxID=1230531 RepID=UPI00053DD3C2|nr:hypothetical protein [Wocania ichthyoenteri]